MNLGSFHSIAELEAWAAKCGLFLHPTTHAIRPRGRRTASATGTASEMAFRSFFSQRTAQLANEQAYHLGVPKVRPFPSQHGDKKRKE